jgi:RNA polymerase sigma-70 factor (ECF subfamily)
MALGRETANVESFDVVFTVHRDYVYGLAYAVLGNAQDAEDVTQDVFLRVYKALPSYQSERGSMRTWLTRITVNACQTHRRRNFFSSMLRRPSAEDAEAALDRIDSSILAAPEDHVLRTEIRRAVKDVIAGLKPDQRAVLVLHYYMDMSAPEIASIMDCPEGTVYSRLHYARHVVQTRLERRALHPTRDEVKR